MKVVSKYIVYFSLIIFLAGCEREKSPENTTDPGFEEVLGYSPDTLRINSMVIDPAGNTWIGSDSGLYRLSHNGWQLFSEQKNRRINSLTLHGNIIYIASSAGAGMMEFQDGVPVISNYFGPLNPGFPFNKVGAFGTGLGNRTWFGIPEGIVMTDGAGYLKNKNIHLGFSGIWDVNSMDFRYNRGFFGTNGSFLYHITYNPETDAITGATQLKGGAENPVYNYNGELTTDTIFCVLLSADSAVWFGSTAGLTRNLGETKVGNGLFEYHLRGEHVRCLLELQSGDILAGTENGLFRLYGSDWIHYGLENGLRGMTVLCLTEGNDGKIRVGTDRGLSILGSVY